MPMARFRQRVASAFAEEGSMSKMMLELTLSFAEIVGVAAPVEHRVTVTV
jgi:hypothetical protein